jgi:hypothetical protein
MTIENNNEATTPNLTNLLIHKDTVIADHISVLVNGNYPNENREIMADAIVKIDAFVDRVRDVAAVKAPPHFTSGTACWSKNVPFMICHAFEEFNRSADQRREELFAAIAMLRSSYVQAIDAHDKKQAALKHPVNKFFTKYPGLLDTFGTDVEAIKAWPSYKWEEIFLCMGLNGACLAEYFAEQYCIENRDEILEDHGDLDNLRCRLSGIDNALSHLRDARNEIDGYEDSDAADSVEDAISGVEDVYNYLESKIEEIEETCADEVLKEQLSSTNSDTIASVLESAASSVQFEFLTAVHEILPSEIVDAIRDSGWYDEAIGEGYINDIL